MEGPFSLYDINGNPIAVAKGLEGNLSEVVFVNNQPIISVTEMPIPHEDYLRLKGKLEGEFSQ